MFDAVNAVLDGPYRPFASKPVSAPGASPEAAAIRAAYIVALNEFPTKTATIDSAYNTLLTQRHVFERDGPVSATECLCL
jgi:hypothetical protein